MISLFLCKANATEARKREEKDRESQRESASDYCTIQLDQKDNKRKQNEDKTQGARQRKSKRERVANGERTS